jgi:transposase
MTTVKRYVKLYREGGVKAFFTPAPKREGSKLTPERLQEAQAMLNEGESIPAVSKRLGVLQTTLHKAVGCGRLEKTKKKRN